VPTTRQPPDAALLLLGGTAARRCARDRKENAVLGQSGGCLAVAVVALLAAATARAAPPQDSDPTLNGWIESLKQPGTGVSCCSVADCGPVDYRLASEGYEALLDARWVRVPDGRILRGISNPMARGVLCRSPISGTILCFVPANET
jgi:hypothetical protein